MDSDRGTGRTTRILEGVAADAANHISTLYVSRDMREALYAMRLLCKIVPPEKGERHPLQVQFPDAVVRFVSQRGDPESHYGWRGTIVFDHNAAPRLSEPNYDWIRWKKWVEFANYKNARQRS